MAIGGWSTGKGLFGIFEGLFLINQMPILVELAEVSSKMGV